MIHLTDQKLFSIHELALRVDYQIKEKGNKEELHNLRKFVKAVFIMIDNLAMYKMSQKVKRNENNIK